MIVVQMKQCLLNVQLDDIILVQVFFKAVLLCDFQTRKKGGGIPASAIVGCHHVHSHGFAKPPRTADTDKALYHIQQGICPAEKQTFIHINLRIYTVFKICIVRTSNSFPYRTLPFFPAVKSFKAILHHIAHFSNHLCY